MPETVQTLGNGAAPVTPEAPETIMDLAGTLTMAALAREAGLSRSHLSLILRGKRQPSLDTCYRLATALKRDVVDIIRLLPQTERQQLFLRVQSGFRAA